MQRNASGPVRTSSPAAVWSRKEESSLPISVREEEERADTGANGWVSRLKAQRGSLLVSDLLLVPGVNPAPYENKYILNEKTDN